MRHLVVQAIAGPLIKSASDSLAALLLLLLLIYCKIIAAALLGGKGKTRTEFILPGQLELI